jgi:phospholipase C
MTRDSGMSRRGFLASLAAGGAGLGLTPALLSAVQRAFAVEPTPGSTWADAEHVVFLMQENRSFDHVYGSLQGVRGFNDPRALTLPSGRPVWCQATTNDEVYTPFRLDLRGSRMTWMGCLPHGWGDQVDARNGGRHDRWLPTKMGKASKPLTLGYHTREDLPFYYALADAFTVCDQHFCSTLTGTTPNRLHFWSGTIRERPDPAAMPHLHNSDSDHFGKLTWTTYPERLTRAGIPWKVYQNELTVPTGLSGEAYDWLANFGDNPLEYFARYQVRHVPRHQAYLQRQIVELPVAIEQAAAKAAAAPQDTELAKKLADLKRRLERARHDVGVWTRENAAKMSAEERTIHQQAFTTNEAFADFRQVAQADLPLPNGGTQRAAVPQGDVLAQFRADVTNGKLPPVSWLVAPRNFSDHPDAPWYGAWYVSEVLNILAADPARWRKTIFVLTYDENDGFFDHHPTFAAPNPQDAKTGACSPGIDSALDFTTRERTSPIGFGYRVPLVIASPWTRGGWVDSHVCDHTSSLRFLEHFIRRRFGVEVREENITPWRRTVSGDLTSVFRPWRGEAVTMPAFLDQRTWLGTILQAKKQPEPEAGRPLTTEELTQIATDPRRSPRLPQQEPGTRPATALPYDLMVDGGVDAARAAVVLDLRVLTRLFGERTAGAPFQVHALRGNVSAAHDVQVRDFAVAAGATLSAAWTLSDFTDNRYHLRVHGPNGFFRELRGGGDDPLLSVHADTEVDANGTATGQVRIVLRAAVGSPTLTIHLASHGYDQAPLTRTLNAGAETTLSMPLTTSHGWYDFSVTVGDATGFLRRYAGRVETGLPSRTDPVMGRETAG